MTERKPVYTAEPPTPAICRRCADCETCRLIRWPFASPDGESCPVHRGIDSKNAEVTTHGH